MAKKENIRIFYLIPNRKKPIDYRKYIKEIIKLNFAQIKYIPNNKNVLYGGIKILYQHCKLLNEIGFYAIPLLLGHLKIDWFDYDVEFNFVKNIGYNLSHNDIVVCPETVPYEGSKFKNAKKIMFIQSWIGIKKKKNFLQPKDYNKNYFEMGYDGIIACSQYVTDYLCEKGKGKATTITNGIDRAKFKYIPQLKRENTILWISRKNPQDGMRIINIVRKKMPFIKFVEAHNLTQAEIIQEYQKADIFLATGYPEGFGLPPLEAMACGCAVVGFTGGGAREFMIDKQTAMVCEDGDTENAAKKLIELLQNKGLKEFIRRNGHNKSKEYCMERMKRELRNFYENFVRHN